MHTFNTIIPIFAVILIGWAARRKGYLPPAFLETANRLVYYLAIPAMIFRAIATGSFRSQFDPRVLAVTLVAILGVFLAAWVGGVWLHVKREQLGTFTQCTFHGNLGYIGLAVAYYALGADGLARASILAGFIMILQNFLAVVGYQIYVGAAPDRSRAGVVAVRIMGNPVIVSAMAAIVFSILDLPMPLVIERSLNILGDLALPMALLIIGASLSFKLLRMESALVLPGAVVKLMVLPALGFVLFKLMGIDPEQTVPALILLGSPTATLTYVMAREMGGDAELAVAAVSASTLLSAFTLAFWLGAAG